MIKRLLTLYCFMVFSSSCAAVDSGREKLYKNNIIDSEVYSYLEKQDRIEKKLLLNFENNFLNEELKFTDSYKKMKESAEKGDVRSLYYIALYFLDVKGDCGAGIHWLTKAFEEKLVHAAVKFGVLIEKGKCGFSPSVSEAIPYLEIGLRALEPESMLRLYFLAKKNKYKPTIKKEDMLLHSAYMGLPIAQIILAREILLSSKLSANQAFSWYLLAFSDGTNSPIGQDIYSEIVMVKEKYNGRIDKEGYELLKRLGGDQYYKFLYSDQFEGEEYFK